MPADASTGTIQIFQPQAFICFKLSWMACPPDKSGRAPTVSIYRGIGTSVARIERSEIRGEPREPPDFATAQSGLRAEVGVFISAKFSPWPFPWPARRSIY